MVLKEEVTIEREVDPRIADLVHFFRYVVERGGRDRQHGED